MTDHQLLARIRSFRADPKNQSPHALFVGLELVDIDRGRGTVRIPYSADLAGDPETGVLHGGLITATLDSACGLAVIAAFDHRLGIATLDLRIDYLKPATPGEAVVAAAHCYKTTRNVCFVRGIAYHSDNPDDPIANCTATFMITADSARDTDMANNPPVAHTTAGAP